jgi:predicted membrane-bound dolichyl-phosphate-mannose-protein mannosyltransferase
MRKFKVGDEVFSTSQGRGIVQSITSSGNYKISVEFDNRNSVTFTESGMWSTQDKYRTLFHSKEDSIDYLNNLIVVKYPLVFMDWLADKGISKKAFLIDIINQYENTDKPYIEKYINTLNYIINNLPINWILSSINFSETNIANIRELNGLWITAVSQATINGVEIKFE